MCWIKRIEITEQNISFTENADKKRKNLNKADMKVQGLRWYQTQTGEIGMRKLSICEKIWRFLFGCSSDTIFSKNTLKEINRKAFSTLTASTPSSSSSTVTSPSPATSTSPPTSAAPLSAPSTAVTSTPVLISTDSVSEGSGSIPSDTQIPAESPSPSLDSIVLSASSSSSTSSVVEETATAVQAPQQEAPPSDPLDREIWALARSTTFVFNPQSKDQLGRPSIYVHKRVSQRPGFGTESTRLIVRKSMALGFGGRFHNDASWSSHLFHLYMGMVPVDQPINFIEYQWGFCAPEAIEKFEKLKECLLDTDDNLSIEERNYIQLWRKMLGHCKGLSYEEITAKKVTNQMIYDELPQHIEGLKSRTVSSLKNQFIPRLLEILEDNISEARPNTNRLGSVPMVLSEEGLARWKAAIEGNTPFASFKRLEHLHAYMTPEQVTHLNKILDAREASCSKAAIILPAE